MQRFLRWRTIGAPALALCLMTAVMPAVAAQEATPELSTDPDRCTVEEPRTVAEMQAIYGTPAPAGAAEARSVAEATPVDFTLPEGEPADEATIAAVTDVVLTGIACFNAGDLLAANALVTDDFIASIAGLDFYDEDWVAAVSASPVPLAEEEYTRVLGVREATVLADGRVAVLVDYSSPVPPVEGIDGVETDLWIYAEVDGAWLLDEVVENLERTYGPPELSGTPAAG